MLSFINVISIGIIIMIAVVMTICLIVKVILRMPWCRRVSGGFELGATL